jgi:HlyD family secretion protein
MVNYLVAAVVVVPCALALVGCRDRGPALEPQGVVELEEHVVGFEASGIVQSVRVRRGDRVKKGDVLAEVDSTMEKLTRDTRAEELQAARADLALLEAGSRQEDIAAETAQLRGAEASLDLAQTQRDRAAALRASQSIAQAELDRAEADLTRAKNEKRTLAERVTALRRGARSEEVARSKARALAAEATLSLEEARLDKYTVRAGTEGIVTDVHALAGELASPGVPVATIADVAHPYVEIFVAEGELGGVAVGTKAQIRVDSSPSPVPGVVEHVSPRAEFTPKFVFSERERPNIVVRVRVRAEDPEGRLHAGVPAFAHLER